SGCTRRRGASGGRSPGASASRRPVPFSPPPRSCPRGSAGIGTPACSRESRRRSSSRAARWRCSRGSCPGGFALVRSCCGLLGCRFRKKLRVEAVVVHEVVKDLAKDRLVFFQHLHRLEQGVVSVAKKLDITMVQYPVLVVGVPFNDFAEVVEAVEGRGLLEDAAQD